MAMGLRDLEDAVQAVCAIRVEADYIVTRNAKDFRGSRLTVATPAEVLARL
nr:hypothetical protein [Gemmatirosa kalamazoonensis]